MTNRIHSILRSLLLAFLCGALVFSAMQSATAQESSGSNGLNGGGGGNIGGVNGGGGNGGCANPLIDDCGPDGIILMQPLDDQTRELQVSPAPLQVFFDYFNLSWPWLLGVASGIAVLQAVWGGVLIMTSWDNDGGKEKIEWALGGMVMIALAGFILRFLNPIFYA